MQARLRLVAALSVSLLAAPADADLDCHLKAYEWDLELTRVELESGDPNLDLNAVAEALGREATLRGGFRNKAHPKLAPRAYLLGSGDGAGLNVGLEKSE